MENKKTLHLNLKKKWFDMILSGEKKAEYRNITSADTLKFFRRLGGTESAQYSYTCDGYTITFLTSTSPDKQKKTIREFSFS
jgi:hypothetical protein